MLEAGFVDDGGGHSAEAVAGHLAFVAQAVKSEQHGGVADGFIPVAAGEHEAATAGYFLEFGQYGKRLPRGECFQSSRLPA